MVEYNSYAMKWVLSNCAISKTMIYFHPSCQLGTLDIEQITLKYALINCIIYTSAIFFVCHTILILKILGKSQVDSWKLMA